MQFSQTALRQFLLFVSSLVLLAAFSSCNFTLKGNTSLAAKFPEMAVLLQQPNSELSRELLRALSQAGINVTEVSATTSTAELPILSVSAESLSNRPVTVNPRARAAQYDLQLSVTINLLASGELLLDAQTLVAESIYFESIATIAGNLEEVETIQSEMRKQLVSQLLRRLEAL